MSTYCVKGNSLFVIVIKDIPALFPASMDMGKISEWIVS